MNVKECPSRDKLRAHLRGNLPDAEADAIAEHLKTCAECASAVQELRVLAASPTEQLQKSSPVPSRVPSSEETLAHTGETGNEPMTPEQTDTAEVEIQRLGQYVILEKLGQGGMGAVYKARHEKLDRLVALKVLPKHRVAAPDALARFEREMKAVGRLDHPNIVRADDAQQIDGTHFLVMEYVEGLDLSQIVARRGSLPVADACEVIRQAALGLQCAHEHRLVHRDVKPSNLMLTPQGEVKLLDLGLARLEDDYAGGGEVTSANLTLGTADYIAPEQAIHSHNVDVRADVYSLGCTLYALLAGHAPFSGEEYGSAIAKIMGHARDPMPPIRDHRPDLPAGLVKVLDRMVAKAPEDRFNSPGDVVDAIGSFCAGSDPAALLADILSEEMESATAEKPEISTRGHNASALTQTRSTGQPAVSPSRGGIRGKRLVAAVALVGFCVLLGAILLSWTKGGPERSGGISPVPEGSSDGNAATEQPEFPALPEWDDFAWVSPRFCAAAIVHPVKAAGSPIAAPLRECPEVAEQLATLEIDLAKLGNDLAALGNDLPTLERTSLLIGSEFVQNPQDQAAAMSDVASVIEFSQPQDVKQLIAKLAKVYPMFEGELAETQIAGRACYQPPGTPLVACNIDNHTIATASPEVLGEMLAAQDETSPLKSRLTRMDLAGDVFLVLAIEPIREFLIQTLATMHKNMPKYRSVYTVSVDLCKDLPKKLDTVTIALDLSGDTLLKGNTEARNEAEAKEFKGIAVGGLLLTKLELARLISYRKGGARQAEQQRAKEGEDVDPAVKAKLDLAEQQRAREMERLNFAGKVLACIAIDQADNLVTVTIETPKGFHEKAPQLIADAIAVARSAITPSP